MRFRQTRLQLSILALAVFGFSLPGLAQKPDGFRSDSKSDESPQSLAEDDIREAVFRYQFEHEATQQKRFTTAIFVAVDGGKDPSDKFLKRFKGNRPQVKKNSLSVISQEGVNGVIDRETSGAGIRYGVGQIKWLNANEVEVDASYYVANLFAAEFHYRVGRDGNKWVVKGLVGSRVEA